MDANFPIVVLLSGNGSNLQAIIDAIAQHQYAINIKAVISDRADAFGLQRAQRTGLATTTLSAKSFANRQDYDRALQKTIEAYQPKLVVLAGFMRILSADFVTHFAGRLINIHPSLLPKHKGLNTHQRAIDAGDTMHGCSIHFVTQAVDGGKVIAQLECPISPDDDAQSLQQKVHRLEHQLYPQVIQQFATGQIGPYD